MVERSGANGARDAKARLREKLSSCVRTGTIRLSSGKTTDFYFDGRLVTLDPEGSVLVARLMLDELAARSVDAVGGPTSGADPIISSLGVLSWERQTPLRLFFVRRERKEHGTGKRVEGPELPRTGSDGEPLRVALVDDVLTTGGSLLRASEALLEDAGVRANLALVIVDREEGGRESLAAEGIELVSLFRKSDLV